MKIRNITSPIIVAEMSGNHGGSLTAAKELISAAKEVGADAVKIQTYQPRDMTINHDGYGFVIQEGLWKGRRLWDLYREASTPISWHGQLFEHATDEGIELFSSPFSVSSVNLLEELGCPVYKIASFEIDNKPLLKAVAETGKPVIISTGAIGDRCSKVYDAVNITRDNDVALLHCIAEYPTMAWQCRLSEIRHLKNCLGFSVGWSDHTVGINVAIAAAALGASIIEKHICLNRRTVDAAFSLLPGQFRDMASGCREAYAASTLHTFEGDHTADLKKYQRSLYAVREVPAGEVVMEHDVRAIRPGFGGPVEDLPYILGKRASRTIMFGEPFTKDLVLS